MNDTRPSRILLVEDDSVFRLLIKRLVGHDYAICEADCLEAARQQIVSQSFAAVLLDYRLPDGNGLQLLPELIVSDLPVVMMTAMGHDNLAIEAIKKGCQAYLVKDDLTRESLIETLSSAMHNAPAEQQTLRQQIIFPQIVQFASQQCRQTTAALRERLQKENLSPNGEIHQLDRLSRLMHGVSAYARISSVGWTPESLSLTDAIEEVVQTMQPILVPVEIDRLSRPLPPLQSDPEGVKTIVHNLLDFATQKVQGVANASIHLRTMAVNLEACVQIETAKTGANVPPASDEPRTELDVSRLLVEKLNGRLWLEEAADHSRICFALPYQNTFDQSAIE